MLILERTFPFPQARVFRAFTEPDELAKWRGREGYHVPRDELISELKVGGRHHHVKVSDSNPEDRQITDAVFTEFFPSDVFVARQRITGVAGLDPDVPLELRVEFVKTARGTLVRVIQGPYDPSSASDFSDGWESELSRLAAYLEQNPA